MGVHVYWVLYFITDNQDIIMEGQLYWVLFFITDHQEIHGRPGVLGFIFHNRPPRLHTYMEGQITTQ
jgi:hypothetical protein